LTGSGRVSTFTGYLSGAEAGVGPCGARQLSADPGGSFGQAYVGQPVKQATEDHQDLRGYGRVSERHLGETMREIRNALLDADVHYKIAKEFADRVRARALDRRSWNH